MEADVHPRLRLLLSYLHTVPVLRPTECTYYVLLQCWYYGRSFMHPRYLFVDLDDIDADDLRLDDGL